MAQKIEFWFEFASTYSYPAAMAVEDACTQAGVGLVWRPFLLGPVLAAQGLDGSPFTVFPVKGAYMWRDVERLCADASLAFHKPSAFPRGSMLAARIVAAHEDAPWTGAFVRAVYAANFADDSDIGDGAVIGAILSAMGLDPAAVIDAAGTPEAKTALRAATEEAQVRGIFGAPSFTVGDELFWGHDRMDQAIAWAARG